MAGDGVAFTSGRLPGLGTRRAARRSTTCAGGSAQQHLKQSSFAASDLQSGQRDRLHVVVTGAQHVLLRLHPLDRLGKEPLRHTAARAWAVRCRAEGPPGLLLRGGGGGGKKGAEFVKEPWGRPTQRRPGPKRTRAKPVLRARRAVAGGCGGSWQPPADPHPHRLPPARALCKRNSYIRGRGSGWVP